METRSRSGSSSGSCYRKILAIIDSEKKGISQKQDLSEIANQVNKLVG